MSTTPTRIDGNGKINIDNVIEAAAIQIFNSPATRRASINIAYELACKQDNVIVTDMQMSDVADMGLFETNNKVLVSVTGQDTGRSPWARHVVDVTNAKEIDEMGKIMKNVAKEMLPLPKVAVKCFFGLGENAMGECEFLVTQKYAKHALDAIMNFVPETAETKSAYKKSKPLGFKNIKVISHPDWLNPDWQAWKNRVNPADKEQVAKDPEPPRIKMIFEPKSNTAFLLGNLYFGECKKAILTLIWSSFLNNDIGMPIHGSSKTLVLPDGEKMAFITIGLSGSGKSSLGNAYHQEFIDDGTLKDVELGNDDAIVVQANIDETSGLEAGLYNKTDSYERGSFWENTIQSAENALVMLDEDGRRRPYYMDVLSKNGRCISARHFLPGANPASLNTPAPDYICTIQKDNTWGPITLIEDPLLQAAMYITLSTKSTAAENIALDEIGKLKISPGANPFGIWPRAKECDMFHQTVVTHKVNGVLLNTGGFFLSEEAERKDEEIDIPKELSIILYPLLAANKIKWVDWDMMPGTKVPAPGSMEEFFPGYDETFKVSAEQNGIYNTIFNNRLNNRIDWMKGNGIDQKYIDIFLKVLNK